MTEEELQQGNDLLALIAATQAQIDSIIALLADESFISGAILKVAASGYDDIVVGDSSDASDALNGKKSDLETTLASLQEQFSRL